MSDPFDLNDDMLEAVETVSLAPTPPPFLEGLNPEQRQAVETTEGAVLVLSGAGTGKTKVLTTRLSYILAMQKAQPWNCLAVTFTNRAAKEMGERVGQMIGPMAESVWMGTFHRLCLRMLRRHAELIGLKSNFIILDADDQQRLLKQLMEAENIDPKRWAPNMLMALIQRFKDRGQLPNQVSPSESGGDVADGKLLKLYTRYQERLQSLNAADFGDLLMYCLQLFRENDDILQKYRNQFTYILVDEYQDTNVAQYLWLRLLAGQDGNICCVGDDDQSIYSWRGAEVGNILRFERDYPNAQTVRLESNYRSTAPILQAASVLIARNSGRLGKTLRAAIEYDAPEKVKVRGFWSGEEEAREIVSAIEDRQRKGTSLSETAILVRTGFQTRAFEDALMTAGVPYRVVGGPRFYERQEIRDIMAYLRLIAQPADDLSFERIVNKPKRGLGKAALQTIRDLSERENMPMFESAAYLIETDELKTRPKNSLTEVVNLFVHWRELAEEMEPASLTQCVLEESGYQEMWEQDRAPDAPGRVENLKELVSSISEEFESLGDFLEHVALVMDNDENADGERVSLMTIHAAKGLEFDAIFLPGMEEGLFPHSRSLDESGEKGLEEERRLAHVAITRARKYLTMSFAANRMIYGSWQNSLPSRFIEELPAAAVEVMGAQIGQGGNSQAQSGSWSWQGGHKTQQRQLAAKTKVTSYRPAAKTAPGGIKRGTRVNHKKFGDGIVTSVEGKSLTIVFEGGATKKVMASFVTKV